MSKYHDPGDQNVEKPPTPHCPDTMDMFSAHTAGEAGIASSAEHAGDEWLDVAHAAVVALPLGLRFIASELWDKIEGEPPELRAMGAVIQRAKKAGLIAKTGGAQPSRLAHGSLYTEWERV